MSKFTIAKAFGNKLFIDYNLFSLIFLIKKIKIAMYTLVLYILA